MAFSTPTKEIILSRFFYDESRSPNMFHKETGMPAGSFDRKNYMLISFPNKMRVFAHRAVLIIHDIDIPKGMQVDHIDKNPLNNRLDNLRVVSPAVNSRNTGKRNNNTSGITGVSIQKGSWCAYWSGREGKRKTKNFSISKYGYDSAKELAIQARINAIRSMADIGYSATHGEGICHTSLKNTVYP